MSQGPQKPQKLNEHYYSTPPIERCQKKTVPSSPNSLSFTIKLKPTNQISQLQSDLSELNKLNKSFINSDTCTTTSSSGFEGFTKTKDFGDFQVLSNRSNKPLRFLLPKLTARWQTYLFLISADV